MSGYGGGGGGGGMVILPLFDGVMTIEVNGGSHGEGDIYEHPGVPGSDGQNQLLL